MDYMTLEAMRRGGRNDEKQMFDEFKRFMRARGRKRRGSRMNRYYDSMEYDNYDDSYTRHNWYPMYEKDTMEDHFEMQEAKEIVESMHHTDGGRKHSGEKFDMNKAEEVYAKYKSHFVADATPEDVYVAINATYHDLCGLYKTWFGSSADERIILTAITFWFKDEDYQGNKIFEYFED